MAYDIVAKLKEKENENTLNQLAAGVNPSDRKRGKLHEFLKHHLTSKNVIVLNL